MYNLFDLLCAFAFGAALTCMVFMVVSPCTVLP